MAKVDRMRDAIAGAEQFRKEARDNLTAHQATHTEAKSAAQE
jgi:hypothetical protein